MVNNIHKGLNEFLADVDLNSFLDKVQEFNKLDIKNISENDLRNQILKVICFKDKNGMERSVMPRMMGVYPKGTQFFRVRLLKEEDTQIPLKDMRIEADAWNPPDNIVKKRGRLNKVGESLLYTAPMNPFTAIREMKVEENKFFALIVYDALEDIKVAQIGMFQATPELTEEENLKVRMIDKFLHDEFTRDVGEGTEYLYKTSEMIVKDYFDLPSEVQDAWCYPSVADKGSCNVCFRPQKAREKLKLRGVIIAQLKEEQLLCKCIACIDNTIGVFQYYAIGSEKQKEVFPEIK